MPRSAAGSCGGALHEIAAAREAEIAAATGFALGLAARAPARVLWIAEDLSLAESGAPYGPGLDQAGLAPERLITVAAARGRDVLWAMEEALRCRAVGLVIGELRARDIDRVATRRLALAAAAGNTLGLLLRAAPDDAPSAAATRWIVASGTSCRCGKSRTARTASVRRALPRASCAIAADISEPGSWSGTVWNSVSSSQRILSLWLAAAFDRPHPAAVA